MVQIFQGKGWAVFSLERYPSSLPPRWPIDRRKCNRLLLKKSQDPRSSAEELYPNLMMLLKFPQTPSHNRGHPFTWFRFRFSCPASPFPFSTLHFPASLTHTHTHSLSLCVRTNRNGLGPSQNRIVIFGLTKPPSHLKPTKTQTQPTPSRIASAEPRGAGVERELSVEKVMPKKCESRREDALFVSVRYLVRGQAGWGNNN
jgi:hypothetical protein